MKRIFYPLSFIFTMCFVVNVSSARAATTHGIAYYNAGFPQVAKSLLLDELNTSKENHADVCFYLGNIYFEENKKDSAALYFNKGLVADPLNSLNTVGLSMLKIKANQQAAELEINNALKAKNNKGNVDLIIAAGRAFLVNGVLDKAVLYQEQAKKIKPKYAPVYVLLGDVELAKSNTGGACSNYEMAIYYDDACKEAYIKYARAYKNVNTPLAIEKLNVLKQKDPSFLLVDRELADIYYSINDLAKAAELYGNYLKSGNSNVLDLTKYASTLFFKGDFAKSLEVVKLGLVKAPKNPAFNRLAMYNNVALKNYDDALAAADLFFNKSDKPEIQYFDYTYYGQALRAKKQFDLAILEYEKAIKFDSTQIGVWKEISDMYAEKGDNKKSVEAYQTYMNLLPADKPNVEAMLQLGKLYYTYGNEVTTTPDIKKDVLVKADSLFSKVAALEPANYRGNFWRARTNFLLESEATPALGKPFYEQTIALVESKADVRFNSVIIECSRYLGYYYYMKSDFTQSKIYWNKILAIEPTNSLAIQAIEGMNKPAKPAKK
jgi:tetratricopeptide (TPR) repeat protein